MLRTRTALGIAIVLSAVACWTPASARAQGSPAIGVLDQVRLAGAGADGEQLGIQAAKSDALTLDANGNSKADAGDRIHYTIAVSNGDPTTSFTGVTFRDTPDPITTLVDGSVSTTKGTVTRGNGPGDVDVLVDIGNLLVAESLVIEFDVTVSGPVPLDVTQVANQGVVSCVERSDTLTDDPDTPLKGDPTITPMTTPNVSAEKTDALLADADGDGLADPGDTIQYTILITNTGDRPTTGAWFADLPDANTPLTTGTVTTTLGAVVLGNNPGDSSVLVDMGMIPDAGGTVMIQFNVQVIDPLPPHVDAVCNQGVVVGANFPPTLTDDPDTVYPGDSTCTYLDNGPDVSAEKTDALLIDNNGNGQADPGDTILYTIVFANTGNQVAQYNYLYDTPDYNTQLVAGSVTTTQGSIYTGNGSGDTNVYVYLGALASFGGTATVTFQATVNDPLPGRLAAVANQGDVYSDLFILTDDPDTSETLDPTLTPVNSPDIFATKTDRLLTDARCDGLAGAGDIIQYTIVVTNNEDHPTTLTFEDGPDGNTTLVVGSVTTTQGNVITGNGAGDTIVLVDLGLVADGGAVITFQVTVADPLPPAVSWLSDQGFLHGNELALTPTDDPDTPALDDPTLTPARIGPDAFGYVAVDNSAPGGPPYQFIDISATGAVVVQGDDTSSALPPPDGINGPVALPSGKSFPFYGVNYSQFAMASNGYLSTDAADDGSDSTPDCPLPQTPSDPAGTTGARLYALHEDLILAPGLGRGLFQYFDVAPRPSDTGQVMGCSVFMWDEAQLPALDRQAGVQPLQAQFFDFEAILYDNGDIVFQYDSRYPTFRHIRIRGEAPNRPPMGRPTVGIQDPAPPTTGLTYSCGNAGNVAPNRVVRISRIRPRVQATKTDQLAVDQDINGLADPGDTIEYTIVVTNTGDQETSPITFTDTPDEHTALVVGSVTTTQGTVVLGNGPGDTEVEVDLGIIADACTSATVVFRVTVDDPLPTDVTEVANQGTLSGGNFADQVTGDPDSPDPDAPTLTPVVPTPLEIGVDPRSLDFGAQDIDDGPTAPQLVTISNEGATSLTVSSVSIDPPSEFAIVSDSGETPLGPGQSRAVWVQFDPALVRHTTDTLTVVSNDTDEPVIDVLLSGDGTQNRGAPIIQSVEDTGQATTATLTVRWINPNEVPWIVLALAYDIYNDEYVVFDPPQSVFYPVPPLETSATLAVPYSGGYDVWSSNLYSNLEWFPSEPWSWIAYTGIPHPILDVSVEDLGGGRVRLHWRPDIYGTWLYEIIPFQSGVGFITVPHPSDQFVEFGPWAFIDYGELAYDHAEANFYGGQADFSLPGSGEYWLFIRPVGWLPPYYANEFVLGHIVLP